MLTNFNDNGKDNLSDLEKLKKLDQELKNAKEKLRIEREKLFEIKQKIIKENDYKSAQILLGRKVIKDCMTIKDLLK